MSEKPKPCSLRILVADDEALGADMLGDLLRAAGHSVRVEYDGHATAAAVMLEYFDVAFLDIEMPFVSGRELAKQIKRRHPDTMIVAVSGSATSEDVASSKRNGFDEIFAKPVRFDDLVALVDIEAIRRQTARSTR